MRLDHYFLVICAFCFLFYGCASTSEERKEERDEDKEFLHRFEKTFNPADYDPDISARKPEEGGERKNHAESIQPAPSDTESEIISGFRIQVSFTDNIEQANSIKNELDTLAVDQPVYVVYEAPYYKVRVGDFLSRPEANLTLKSLVEKGYKDAWIVPDKVLKESGR